MDDNDKIIKLSDVLEKKYFGTDFILEFAETDCDNDFDPMDTERLLEAAAEMVNMEVVLKGKESAKLRIREVGISQRYSGFDDY